MVEEVEREASQPLETTFEEVVAQVGSVAGGSHSSKRLVAGTLYASSAAARPTCAKCRRPWRWPRNIAHVNMVCNVPDRIKPTTKATVVAHLTVVPGSSPPKPTICETIFRQLELLHTPEGIFRVFRNRITREFLYHAESGYVNYDVSTQQDSGFAYARLITLNSWYMALFKCLMIAMLSVLDHHANLLLIVQLFFAPEDPMVIDFGEARYPFAIGWLVMLLLTLLVASHSAWVEWRIKVGPRVGDLIHQCGLFDSIWTFAAMTCFAFFAVEQQVKDVVIVLHPWKSIQPYAAFKSDGVRAYCVGYMDEYLFQVENMPGFYAFFAQLLMRTFVFVFKTYRLFLFPSPALVVSVASSVGSVCFGWRAWLILFLARRRLRVRLLQIVRDQREGCEATEHWRRQRDAAKKLLSLHYNYTARETKEAPRSHTFSPFGTLKPECPKCGRDVVGRIRPDSPAGRTEDATKFDAPKLVAGQQVRLSEAYNKFHDAKYGPLQPGDVGEVLDVGPWIPICGARTLVAFGTGELQRTWWYDEGAVEPAFGGEAASPARIHSVEDRPLGSPQPSADDQGELSEELRGLVARLLQEPAAQRRRHATELLKAAEALASGQGEGADVLRIPSGALQPKSPEEQRKGHSAEMPQGMHPSANLELPLEVITEDSPRQPLPGSVLEDAI